MQLTCLSCFSGGSRISHRREHQPQDEGANLLFCQKFPENCMKMKEFGSRGRGDPRVPGAPLDPPMCLMIKTTLSECIASDVIKGEFTLFYAVTAKVYHSVNGDGRNRCGIHYASLTDTETFFSPLCQWGFLYMEQNFH